MKAKALIIFGLAIVVGIGAVFMIKNWMQTRSVQVAKKAVATTTVVIAKTPLRFGAVIRAENIVAIKWPARAVPKGSFRTVKDLVNDKEPRVVLRPVETNEPLLKSKVSGFGGRASLSAVISDKMRGSTIRVNDVNGVAGFVLPGDRVDVLLTRDKQGGKLTAGANLITDVLLQNVKVLAIDQNLNENKEKPSIAKAVTLEVTPHQGQKLVLAQKVGTLSLALRNATNAVAASTRTVSIADLSRGEVNDGRRAKVEKKQQVQQEKKQPKKIVKRRMNSFSRIKVVRGLEEFDYQVVKEGESGTIPQTEQLPDESSVTPDASAKLPMMKKPVPRPSPKIKKVPISLIGEEHTTAVKRGAGLGRR